MWFPSKYLGSDCPKINSYQLQDCQGLKYIVWASKRCNDWFRISRTEKMIRSLSTLPTRIKERRIKLSLATPWTYQAIPELLQTLQQKRTKNRDSVVFIKCFFCEGSSAHIIRTEMCFNYFKTSPHICFNIAKFPKYDTENN